MRKLAVLLLLGWLAGLPACSKKTPTAPPVITGDLQVTTDPPGAVLTLDGEEKGLTPLTVTGLSLGKHELILSKFYFVTWSESLAVTGAGTLAKSYRLFTSGISEIWGRDSSGWRKDIYFRIPVDANGWKWWDHVNASRTIANGSSNWYFSAHHFHQARHPDLSVNPFGAISRTASPAMGLSLAPLFYPPQAYAIQYNSQGGLWIEFEMGTTPNTTKHPNTAELHFVFYKHDPDWGDRSAVARYYTFFPQWFEKRYRGGNWLVDYGNYPTTPADFSIAYLETNNFANSWTDNNNWSEPH